MFKHFQDMPIWQGSMDLAVKIFDISESFPKKEDYSLTSQIRRSALSIPANIAEAFGRFHKKDKINFYYFARGSITETQSHLIYSERVNYLKHETTTELIDKLNDILCSINKVIKTLKTLS